MVDPKRLLTEMFAAAVRAAQPANTLPAHLALLRLNKHRPLTVLGAGKASAAMARALEDNWQGPVRGLVVTRYGYRVACEKIEIIEASHPVSDEASQTAAQRVLHLAQNCTKDDTIVFLMSGGGSALMELPLLGCSLGEMQQLNADLLRSGATIAEMNCVRRHLSAIKGGRLAAAAFPARQVTMLISDVPGDQAHDIASGPTVGDPTRCAEALLILERYGIQLSAHLLRILTSGAGETIKPDDVRLAGQAVHFIATPQMALEAAAQLGRQAGFAVHILGDAIEGEARHVASAFGGMVQQIVARAQPFTRPCILLSGGETSVSVRNHAGKGGRNVEFLLSLALATRSVSSHVWALAADTDGVDGSEEIAGAMILPDSLARAQQMSLSARQALDDNDAHRFFMALGDSIVTGPTLTNVNDFRAILIG